MLFGKSNTGAIAVAGMGKSSRHIVNEAEIYTIKIKPLFSYTATTELQILLAFNTSSLALSASTTSNEVAWLFQGFPILASGNFVNREARKTRNVLSKS